MMPSRPQTRIRAHASRPLFTCALLLLGAVSVEAQTLNPRLVEFDPSPDHSGTWSDGQAKVSRYDLEVYQQGASAPFHKVNMGKPSLQSDGKVRFDFSSQVAAWPLPGGIYLAKVSAVGPTGTGRSDASNTFTFGTTSSPPPTCSYSLAPTGATVPASGGAGSFAVSSGTGCGWSATSSASWLKVTAATGAGSGTVSYSVAANSSTSARAASVSVGGQVFTVSQGGAAPTTGTSSCSYAVSPQALDVDATGGSASVSVASTSACSWTASSTTEWILLASSSGSGGGSVSFSVARNDSLLARTGAIAVGGQLVSITQAGAASATCTIAVSPGSRTVPVAGGSGTFDVATSPGCAWTARVAVPWLRVSPSSGTGSGSVGFTADSNPDAAARSATLDVAGGTATVVQEGRTCTYTLSATTFQLSAAGGPAQVTVSTSPGCTWTVVSSAGWLVPSVGSGTGTADIRFEVKRNWAASPKTATLTIGSAVVTVSVASGSGPGAPKNFKVTVAK